jgi:hypothetical protein
MPPMPREQRKVAHQLAEAYGLTTVSLGSEPHRYVEVVKVSPSASIPGQLLSAAAKAVPTAQARQMAQVSEPTFPALSSCPHCLTTFTFLALDHS